ncbi:MAG: 23S rRNA (pseudouridine(1915)-N(3))-methyltransferase RlmH [Salibacteraceae bacterium]
MKIRIISIGKTNIAFVKEGLDEYLNRLKHYTKLSWEELPDYKNIERKNQDLLKEKEGALLLKAIHPNDILFLLDDKGKQKTSEQLAHWIEHHQLYEQNDLVLVIGGAYGFSKSIEERARGKISLSKLTFNHQMVRLILAEQLYRAFSIIKGEPYHHA